MTSDVHSTSPGTLNFPVHQMRWEHNLQELVRFTAEHGRFPLQTAAAPSERKLACWLRTQRAGTRPDRVEALDRAFPVWRVVSFDNRWDETLKKAISFTVANGRRPRSGGGDQDEMFLGNWLAQQRRMTTPGRAARLDLDLPGWRETSQDVWSKRAAEVAAFVSDEGHIPRQTGATAFERSMANWLKSQRMTTTEVRASVLDRSVPGWRGNHPGHMTWARSLASAKTFVTENGRFPSRAFDAEARLASWIYDQTRRASTEQREILDNALPGWNDSRPSWDERHLAAVAFHEAHGRIPARKGTAEEKALGEWVTTQKCLASKDRREILDSTLPGWHVTLEDKWNARLTGLKEHVAKNGRLPRVAKSATPEERILGRWLEKQRQKADEDRTRLLDTEVPCWRGRPKTK